MPLISTRGAASAQGFGEFAQSAGPVYIEDVFSTYLYTGNGSTQTITNGIDLSGKGGLVWFKNRGSASGNNWLFDSARNNFNNILITNTTDAQLDVSSYPYDIDPTASGFTIKGAAVHTNTNGNTYASWTFRKQAKFFDVVTYTGTGSARTVAHSLGSVPGCIIIKGTSVVDNWYVWHRSLPSTTQSYLNLNTTGATASSAFLWGNTAPGAVNFTVSGTNNTAGQTYVAYLFAHDAGGFGLSGTDNVISCGSYTGNGSATGPVITLGYEPQWLLIKNATDGATNWTLIDNMRGLPVGSAAARLHPNLSDAEYNNITVSSPLPTGFQITNTNSFCNTNGSTYIYIAIRRGPMKVPTSGTQIANPKGLVTLTSGQTVTTGFVTDMTMAKFNGTQEWLLSDRLRNTVLYPNTADSEGALYGTAGPRPFDVQDGFKTSGISGSYALWGFRRAPGFMDVVCYTGNGAVSGSATRSIPHNLASVPELIICKARDQIDGWRIYNQAGGINQILNLNQDSGYQSDTTNWGTPTSTNFLIKYDRNWSGWTFVAYLFATVAGVSKVGSYTGSGTTKQIDCGFTGGARFVLIKRTDSTGNWHLYDSGQGIVAGNDPYFLVNTSDGQYVGSDYVDTYSAGFELSSTAPAGLNANGGTYIFLAIA